VADGASGAPPFSRCVIRTSRLLATNRFERMADVTGMVLVTTRMGWRHERRPSTMRTSSSPARWILRIAGAGGASTTNTRDGVEGDTAVGGLDGSQEVFTATPAV